MNRRLSLPDVLQCPFFHPNITTLEQVIQVFEESGFEHGSFLVRRSFSQPSQLTLSVRHEQAIYHMKVERTPSGGFQLSKGVAFPTLDHLLRHFSINPVTNVEKLDGVYLLKGILCREGRPLQLLKPSQSPSVQIGVDKRISCISNASNASTNSNYSSYSSCSNYSSCSDYNSYNIISSNINEEKNNPYIHPFLSRSLEVDDGFEEEDTYLNTIRMKEPAKKQVLALPCGWEAVLMDSGVAYRESAASALVTDLPQSVFAELSVELFKKLRMHSQSHQRKGTPLPSSTTAPSISPSNSSSTLSQNRKTLINRDTLTPDPTTFATTSSTDSLKTSLNIPTTTSPTIPLKTLKYPVSAPIDSSKFFVSGGSVYARMDKASSLEEAEACELKRERKN